MPSGTAVANTEMTRAGRIQRGSAKNTPVNRPTANAELNSLIAITEADTFGLAKTDIAA